MHKKFIICLLVGGFSLNVYAGILSESERRELTSRVLQNFWGKAKLSDGTFVQAGSEAERRTVPISTETANRALDAGEISGLAELCGIDWQPHYFSLTSSARKNGMSDKQVAFISFLHGAAQGRIFSAMEKSASCNAQDKSKIEKMLNQSSKVS